MNKSQIKTDNYPTFMPLVKIRLFWVMDIKEINKMSLKWNN